jgi:hypothetical protein
LETISCSNERLSTDTQERMPTPIRGRVPQQKDTIVKKLKADIKAVNKRLRTVAENDKRTEEMAKIKAERAAAPPKEQEGGKGEKPKKAAEQGKGKKAKPEGGKAPKAPGPAKEGKPEVKKSVEEKA